MHIGAKGVPVSGAGRLALLPAASHDFAQIFKKYEYMKFVLPVFFLFFSVGMAFTQSISEPQKHIFGTEVYFDFGLYDLRPDADSTLRELVGFLENKSDFSIKITAHTDFVGSNSANMTLSENRAKAVKQYLVEKGIPEAVIETAVYGESKPKAPNDTEEGRQLNRRATIDVFKKIPLVTLEARILDEDSGQPLEADFVIHTKTTRDTLHVDTSGLIRLPVPLNAIVGIDIYAKCYFFKTVMLRATPEEIAKLKFDLRKAEPGKAMDIENLYFVGNQDVLLPKSEPELPKILKFMELNDCLQIEIAGHVNVPNAPPVREGSWEFQLSEKRAQRVANYLLEHGISPDRITAKGYGNWEMKFPNAILESQQAQNRRVEIRIREGSADCLCSKYFEKKN